MKVLDALDKRRCGGMYSTTNTLGIGGKAVSLSGWAQCEKPHGHPTIEPCGPLRRDDDA